MITYLKNAGMLFFKYCAKWYGLELSKVLLYIIVAQGAEKTLTFWVWGYVLLSNLKRSGLKTPLFQIIEGEEKKFTNVFCHTTKMTSPRVKSQARGQNNRSSALKWGIVHLCSSITFRDTTKFMKKLVFQILHFCKKMQKLLC